jgi:hypothetical protein
MIKHNKKVNHDNKKKNEGTKYVMPNCDQICSLGKVRLHEPRFNRYMTILGHSTSQGVNPSSTTFFREYT